MINDLWYKNAIVYCLSVATYLDTNADGIGDFRGLLLRLDYLQGLGATAIWLLPFQPSPGLDDGYDISDYYGVDPRYGSLGDFVGVHLQGCRQRGSSCPDRSCRESHVKPASVVSGSAQRSGVQIPRLVRLVKEEAAKRKQRYKEIFPGVQKSTWDYDDAAKAWYFHRFYMIFSPI